jgi:hypothetical protein
MDATISTEEVTAALGNLPSLDPRPNAVNIRALRVHIERALQLLPCPQSVHHGWKGLAMSRAMYALLVTGGSPFQTPTDPGPAAIYTRADPTDVTPLLLGMPVASSTTPQHMPIPSDLRATCSDAQWDSRVMAKGARKSPTRIPSSVTVTGTHVTPVVSMLPKATRA